MKISSRRVAIAAAAIALTTWVGIAPTAAATPDPPVVQPSSVAPGDSFTVSGGYCDGIVTVTIDALGLSDEVEGGTPPWQVSFVTPLDAVADTYTVVSKCSYFDFPDSTLTVSGEATTTTTSTTTSVPTTIEPSTTTTAGAAAVAAVAATPALTG